MRGVQPVDPSTMPLWAFAVLAVILWGGYALLVWKGRR